MFMIMLNNLLKMHLKLPKRTAQKKNSRSNWWFDSQKVSCRVVKLSRTLPQNSSATVKNEHDKNT